MHKVFISYHHANDQKYKEALLSFNGQGDNRIFIDGSVDTGDISDNLTDEQIRAKIRDEYLKDTTVTILLVGEETKKRKHIDWEIYSSMFDGKVNKKSGILIIVLPSADSGHYRASHKGEKEKVYPETTSWSSIKDKTKLQERYPYMPERIIDNMSCDNVDISIMPWSKINRTNFEFLIDATYKDRVNCAYDMSRKLRRQNS